VVTQRANEEPIDSVAEPSAPHSAFDLRVMLHVLWRRRLLVLGTALLLSGLVALVLARMTPLYVAESQLVFETQRERTVSFEEVLQSGNFDYTTGQTEAAVLMSRDLAERAIAKLNLARHPVFNPELAPAKPRLLPPLPWRQWLDDWLPPWAMAALRGQAAEQAAMPSPEQQARAKHERLVDAFLAGIEVDVPERSRVLKVRYTSEDHQLAAQVANTLAELYIQETVRRKFDATARATGWLNEQVGDLRLRMEAAQAALEEHRRRIGYLNVEGQGSLLAQQLAQLSGDLLRARTARAEAEARDRQVRKLLQTQDGVQAAAAVLQSPIVQRLREQEAKVSRELTELRTQLRDQHPRLLLKENELEDLKISIGREMQKVAQSLSNEHELALIRERSTGREVNELRRAFEEQNNALVRLRSLESEARAAGEVYQAVLLRFKQTDVQEVGLEKPDARLISSAVPPAEPAYPKKPLILAAALVLALALGVLLAFLLEYLDAGFRSLAHAESLTGVQGLGLLPALSRRRLRRRAAHEVMVEEPNAPYAESVRGIRAALMLSGGRPPKTVLVGSAMPGEGKTSLAVSLARAAARSGQRTLLIDFDLRNPSVHENLGVANFKGLADHLSGDADLSAVTEYDERTGLSYVTAGHFDRHPAELLAPAKLQQLCERVKFAYDFVVFDTAPVLAVADTLALARHVDRVVFTVEWGTTQREAVQAALRQLTDAGARIAGVVLSKVNTRRHAAYAYGTYQYYYGAYAGGARRG